MLGSSPARKPSAFHFELKPGKQYNLKAFGKSYPLKAHTAGTLATCLEPGAAPTHFATVDAPPQNTVQLLRVYGPADADGIPTLESLAIYTPQSSTQTRTSDDLAKAIMFLHPSLTVLTAQLAPAVLESITSSKSFGLMSSTLAKPNKPWNTTVKLKDENGNFIKNQSGGYLYEYQLTEEVHNLRAAVSRDAMIAANGNPSLQGYRYNIASGVANIDISPTANGSQKLTAAVGGYEYQLQDPGPDYGFSAEITGIADDGTVTLKISNSYIRHAQVSVSFLEPDLQTAITLEDDAWLNLLLGGSNHDIVQSWISGVTGFIFDSTNKLKFLGTIGAEDTFLGIPVSNAESDFSFKLPTDSPIGKVRILCGSLGTPSGIDWDPKAAWIGIGMTAFLDLVIPTISLIEGVGEESDTLFNLILKDIGFLASTVCQIAVVVEEIVEKPNSAGEDIKSFLIALGDNLVDKVLSASDVAAKLALYFGSEEAEEAIPIAGWALKALALEATVEQLAQTVGEVAGCTRVTEFGMTVTMPVTITLVPSDSSGFANTATTFTVTAQYTDITGYTYTDAVPDDKTSPIAFTWDKMPVGGQVQFIVSLYSKEGWLVGKGTSATLANMISEGQTALVVPDIAIVQLLYPLDSETKYGHNRALEYANGSHVWVTTSAPSETAKDLGSGSAANQLEALTTISLNSDLGILGYGFQATSQGVPLFGTNDTSQPIYTFQNIAFQSPSQASSQPDDGLMFPPAGYNSSPVLVYLRSAVADANGGVAGQSNRSFFFLDPAADSVNSYHLRGIAPVNDPSIAQNSPQRSFDLSTGTSWGRFKILPTSMAVHSTGCVVAVSSGVSKLQILELPDAAVPSANAPWAQLLSGPGTREGLLSLPELVAIAPNQVVLVLEAGNSRIQAFSRGGHPTPAFSNLPTPYWIPLYSDPSDPADITYVSMSVEIKGYIYVLSIEGDGYNPDQFRLDIYSPDGGHLLRQRGINVAALTVDLWRNVYSLNYQQIQGPGGRPEPSVSEWLPSTPNQ